MSNSLGPDQARHCVGPDLVSNCLQRLSADGTSKQRVIECQYFHYICNFNFRMCWLVSPGRPCYCHFYWDWWSTSTTYRLLIHTLQSSLFYCLCYSVIITPNRRCGASHVGTPPTSCPSAQASPWDRGLTTNLAG